MEIEEFLRARLAEDEADIDAARISEAPEWWMPDMWNQKRALAEVESKRQLLDRLAWIDAREIADLVDDARKALALPYADHPDYDERWRP